MIHLKDIESAPRDGTYILLAGPSGYITTPLRFEVCRYDDKYRPKQSWVTYSNDSWYDEGGEAPTHWCEIPEVEFANKPSPNGIVATIIFDDPAFPNEPSSKKLQICKMRASSEVRQIPPQPGDHYKKLELTGYYALYLEGYMMEDEDV